jgi:hypothetical protein
MCSKAVVPKAPLSALHWTAREVDQSAFKDARLGRRCAELLRQMGDAISESIPCACQDWANAKAAYRFLSNARVEESEILGGHFAATRTRCDASDWPILLLQDSKPPPKATLLARVHGR